ncbi:MAG: DUF4350 domain-containing protein [Armatimonadetes bacterium]|nr:DUF4350 domain-containing protein [Armatimonadota bacterium]
MRALLRRHGTALGVVAVFVALSVLMLPSMLGRDLIRDHSAFRKNSSGCAALAELCRRVQPPLRVETLIRPLEDLAKISGPLLILDPEEPFTSSELDEIVRWVEEGGVLIVAVQGLWDDPVALGPSGEPTYVALTGALGLNVVQGRDELEQATPAARSGLTEGVQRVAIRTQYTLAVATDQETQGEERRISLRANDLRPQLLADEKVVLGSFKHGKGEVYVSSDAEMFANAMLGREDNLQLVANLLWPLARQQTVYFDEYHHGFGERAETAAAADPGPLNRGLLLVVVAAAVFLYGKAVRFGAPVQVFDPRRRAAVEYVEALAGLFRRGEANQWALQKIGTALRRRLAVAVGLPASASAEALTTALAERRGIPSEDSARLLAELEWAPVEGGLTARRLTDLVQRATDLEERADPERHGARHRAREGRTTSGH